MTSGDEELRCVWEEVRSSPWEHVNNSMWFSYRVMKAVWGPRGPRIDDACIPTIDHDAVRYRREARDMSDARMSTMLWRMTESVKERAAEDTLLPDDEVRIQEESYVT